jgi:hypothetical protein
LLFLASPYNACRDRTYYAETNIAVLILAVPAEPMRATPIDTDQ